MSFDSNKPHLKLWLKFRVDCQQTEKGTATLRDNYGTNHGHDALVQRYMRLIEEHVDAGRLWQARIYRHPGNEEIFYHQEPYEESETETGPRPQEGNTQSPADSGRDAHQRTIGIGS